MRFKLLHTTDDLTLPVIFRIYDGLRNHSLPKTEWTHEAHLVAGLCLVAEYGLVDAEQLMPDIIRTYNVASGGRNTDSEGYHHTLTIFYLRKIDSFMQRSVATDILNATKALLADPIADRSYPLNIYDKERLFSTEARRGWITP